jgi:hypothetical protein
MKLAGAFVHRQAVLIKTVARQKIRAASAGDLFHCCVVLLELQLIGSSESPPSNLIEGY